MRARDYEGTAAPGDLAWRVVGLLNLYRLLIAPTLFAIYRITMPQPSVGAAYPNLFLWTCLAYFGVAIALIVVQRRRWLTVRALVVLYSLADAFAIALLLYASGGVASGLGILLVVPVGSMALLAEGRIALLVAAVAALGILVQQAASHLYGTASPADYPAAGVIGGVIFLVALATWPLAARLRESEAIVERQEVDLANLAELSQYIVQHLRESLLVVDSDERIRLINESAAQILGDRNAYPGALLGEASPRLLYLLSTWRQSGTRPKDSGATFLASDGAREILAHFAPLGTENPPPALIFLEDTTEVATKLQQLKLASLGRLSASIAHEIRNPVGAMSHAAQLLAESPNASAEDRRLADIVRTNAARASEIIANVQSMSRREPIRPERFALGPWLEEFRSEFCATFPCAPDRVVLDGDGADLEVRCDPSQLRQILWNLCDNALKHASPEAQNVEVRVGRLPPSLRPYLEVADRGPGIAPAITDSIFEPFVTSDVEGTGLGLFLSRELAQANGATLIYEPRPGGGSLFRLVFSDPLRWSA